MIMKLLRIPRDKLQILESQNICFEQLILITRPRDKGTRFGRMGHEPFSNAGHMRIGAKVRNDWDAMHPLFDMFWSSMVDVAGDNSIEAGQLPPNRTTSVCIRR